MASTKTVTKLMLEKGEFYKTQSLGKALLISENKSAFLYNMRTSNKYKTVDTGFPNRTVKVVSIVENLA
ncbi:hypothetical protein AN394_04209 [Pseudoalteromonas sp. P1-26]|nr:hypothetical protein AN394_04209 [Pseudoalteromonas sp. P1-26]